MLDSKMNVKLADFGLSCQLPEGALVQRFCGIPEYSTLEVFQQETYAAFAADIYSFHVILFTMVAGDLPFNGKDQAKLWD